MTKQPAEAAVNLLSTKYPDAMVEAPAELEEDASGGSIDDDYSVAAGGTVADRIDEIIGQLEEDFGNDPEAENIIAQLERLEEPAVELAVDEA